jgi:hypothetical protein
METNDVGARDFMFGASGVLLMILIAVLFAIFA